MVCSKFRVFDSKNKISSQELKCLQFNCMGKLKIDRMHTKTGLYDFFLI